MKKIFLIAVFSIFVLGFVQAQHCCGEPTYANATLNPTNNWPIQNSTPSQPNVILVGSPYVEKRYRKGTALIHGKTDFSAPMRYNSARGVIEFKEDDGITKEMLRRPYIKASFNGKVYEILEYEYEYGTKLGYFNLLSTGKTKLLFRPEKKILIDNISRNNLGERFGRYKDISEYYLKKEGQPAQKIKLTKKSILDSFEVKNRKLLEYAIQKQDLNLTKEKDIILLLKYYDTLKRNSSEIKEMQS